MSDEDYTSPDAVEKLLKDPQSYGNGFRCCFQMIALAKELRESRANTLHWDKAQAHEVEIAKQIIEDLRAQVSRLEEGIRRSLDEYDYCFVCQNHTSGCKCLNATN